MNNTNIYKRYRFPSETIQYTVWLYYRFNLSHRDLEDLLAERGINASYEAIRLWSAWSAVLLGDRGSAVRYLSDLLLDGGKGLGVGLNVLIRSLGLAKSKLLLGELVRNLDTLRFAILGVGITGDTEYIPWLIKQMEVPQYARVAGEALTTITGVDIAYDDLEGEWPDGFEAGPSEDPNDDNVTMDEDLPWPDAKLITGWWRHSQEFQAGRRYLLGKPVTPENCHWILVNGKQR